MKTYVYEVLIWEYKDGRRIEVEHELLGVEAPSHKAAHDKVSADLESLLSDPKVKAWRGELSDYDIEVTHEFDAGNESETSVSELANTCMGMAEELLEEAGVTDTMYMECMKDLSDMCEAQIEIYKHRFEHPLEVQFR